MKKENTKLTLPSKYFIRSKLTLPIETKNLRFGGKIEDVEMNKSIKTVILFLRISKLWDKEISQIAKSEMRTKSSVAKQAIKEFLDKRRRSKLNV